jgi:hypothetical protein
MRREARPPPLLLEPVEMLGEGGGGEGGTVTREPPMMYFFFASVFHFFATECAFSPQPTFYPLFLNEDDRIGKIRPSKLNYRF